MSLWSEIMRFYKLLNLALAGVLLTGAAAPASAQLVKKMLNAVVKNETREAASCEARVSALESLDQMYKDGETAAAVARQAQAYPRHSVQRRIDAMEGGAAVRARLSAQGSAIEKSLRAAAKESVSIQSAPAIIPTPREALQINAYQLTPVQRQQLTNEYYDLMARFAQVRQVWNARLTYLRLSPSFNKMTQEERRHLMRMSLPLLSALRAKSRYLFKDDEPLKAAYAYLVKQIETLEPALMGIFPTEFKVNRYDGRKDWNPSEFFLHNPDGSAYREVRDEEYAHNFEAKTRNALELARELPPGLDIAVLNDHPQMLTQLEAWAAQGYLGAGAKVKVYPTAEALLAEMKWGREFDVILTDLMVLGGGGRYLVYKLREAGYQKPVIGLSEYTEQNARGEELFKLGFDGYIEVNDSFNRFNGYRVVPAALRNFFRYRGEIPSVPPMRPTEPAPAASASSYYNYGSTDYGPTDMFF